MTNIREGHVITEVLDKSTLQPKAGDVTLSGVSTEGDIGHRLAERL